jgi:hypothetical protein
MQQVITITSRTDILKQGQDFEETEYPQIKKYLEEGYVITQVLPILKPADTSYRYAITFILSK